jgi:hypothetical protein
MIGKYPQTTNVNFLHADFSVLKLGKYLKLVATNTYDRIKIHPNELIRQLTVLVPSDQTVSMHSKPRDVLLPRNEKMRHRIQE